MNSRPQHVSRSVDEHVGEQYTGALKRYLSERGYATHTVNAYFDCAGHLFPVGEAFGFRASADGRFVIARFLSEHCLIATAGGRLAVIGVIAARHSGICCSCCARLALWRREPGNSPSTKN